MKTTDLIPLILYQLADGDKYGYEIVKQIEDCSAGKVVIKQPTLYTILKKLEHGKFITSYWQDSEIGGKRHYYKLTENGKAQLDTYPTIEELLADTVEGSSAAIAPVNEQNVSAKEEVVADLTVDDTTIKPITIDISSPTNITESLNSVDTLSDKNEEDSISVSTKEDISADDSEIGVIEQDFSLAQEEKSAEIVVEPEAAPSYASVFDAIEPADSINAVDSSPISIFDAIEVNKKTQDAAPTEDKKTEQLNNALASKVEPNTELAAETPSSQPEQISTYEPDKVKYLNYVDLSADKAAIKRKRAVAKHIQKMALTTISLLLTLVATVVLVAKYSTFTKAYCLCAIAAGLMIGFYPLIVIKKASSIRLKYCSTPFRYSISRDFFTKLAIFLIFVITISAYNISILSNIKDVFSISNIANFLAPIMLAGVVILDLIYSIILYKNYTK